MEIRIHKWKRSPDAQQQQLRFNKNRNFLSVIRHGEERNDEVNRKNSIRDPMSHRIIEKRRRDRMNNSLANLRKLIPTCYIRKGHGRIEKTEIIEMAIKHLQHFQTHSCKDPTNCNEAKISEYEGQQQYYMGFQQCMHETTKFLTEMNGIFSGDNLRVQLVHHLRKYYNKLCEGTHYQTAGIIRSPLSTKNTFEISMDTDCYSPSSTPSDEPQSNSSLGIARYYQPSRQVTLESGKQFSLKAANTSRGITDGLPQTGSLSSQPSQLVESVTENQKSFQFRKVPQNPEHPLKHFHKSSENVGTKNVYPFLSTPHLSPRGNSHGLHKGEEVYKFKKNIKERFTANQQQHMSPTEDSSSPEHLNYNSEPLCGDWHSPLNPHRSIEHSYTHLTPSMLYRHNDNILSMKATEKDCPENDLVSTGLWDNSRSSTVIKFNGSSSNNISYSTVDTCSSNSSSCGFNPSSSSFVRSNGSSSSISGYSTGSDVASYMSKHIIHSPQKDIPLPYSNNRPPMQASGVPIFALHPKGTFYIPLTLDIGLLSPFLNNLGNSVPVLHPVNISVSFGTRSS
ncbi:uncharacterized protein LOC143250528 [Tachypleus tridentatus]|uniref:uncharacterized protein LOC143250528 n=1 Tax=Tachypleus tridentatus TaxID=6853 RepID=UPI003FD20600